MALAVASYERRQPEKTALYRCLQEHLATFIAQAEAADRPLPKFVRREFEAYLGCGILANGFARVHCGACGYDRLVAFSCKKRGFCPSCGGRRMSETAAHLVDHVIPEVPVRQWVLSLPPPLRYLLAYDSGLCSAILNIFIGEVFKWLRRTAKTELGLDSVMHAHPGAVTVIQRFGSALNLNIHLHALIPDGVFVQTCDEEQPVFRALRGATKVETLDIAWATCRRMLALLEKRGLWQTDDNSPGPDKLAEDEPLLAQCYAASISGTLLLSQGKRPMRFQGANPRAVGDHASANTYGFDLDTSVRVPAHDRNRLERLCRYIARPPLANDRLERLPDGHFSLRLKRPWNDGTTHLIFEGVELIGRLVALVPPPRSHQIRFHGVFAPNAKLRSRIVPQLELAPCEHAAGVEGEAEPAAKPHPASQRTWAELMKRVWAIDVLECPRCHSTMQRIASIMMPSAIRAILTSVGQPTAPPGLRPARLAG